MSYFNEVEDYNYSLEEAKFQRDNLVAEMYHSIFQFIVYGREVGFDSVELKQAVTESFSEMPEEMSNVLKEEFNIDSIERFIKVLKVFDKETRKDLTK